MRVLAGFFLTNRSERCCQFNLTLKICFNFVSNKSPHYLDDYGDFKWNLIWSSALYFPSLYAWEKSYGRQLGHLFNNHLYIQDREQLQWVVSGVYSFHFNSFSFISYTYTTKTYICMYGCLTRRQTLLLLSYSIVPINVNQQQIMSAFHLSFSETFKHYNHIILYVWHIHTQTHTHLSMQARACQISKSNKTKFFIFCFSILLCPFFVVVLLLLLLYCI